MKNKSWTIESRRDLGMSLVKLFLHAKVTVRVTFVTHIVDESKKIAK